MSQTFTLQHQNDLLLSFSNDISFDPQVHSVALNMNTKFLLLNILLQSSHSFNSLHHSALYSL